MFSTNKNRKIGMLIFLFVVSFIVGMLINIQRLGSLPMKLIQVEWNDTVGCVYENLDYENPSDHKYDLYVPKNLDTPESKMPDSLLYTEEVLIPEAKKMAMRGANIIRQKDT